MDFATLSAARRPALDAAAADLAAAGVRLLVTHTAEMAGVLRSKIGPLKLSADGEALNALLYATAHADGLPGGDVCFDSAVSNAANGYPNIVALADPATVRRHGWAPHVASVMTNAFLADGAPCPLDVRAVLAAQEARAAAMGFEARFALEYEFGLFHADPAAMREGRFRDLVPWGTGLANYDVVRAGDYQDFVAAFIDRLASIGIGVASFVSEYGHGMYEFALEPRPPLAAADAALRAKLHLRELAAERGLVATFMARFQPPGRESASGAHHHQSLWRDGRNLFAAGAGALPDVARHYLAGLLTRMAEAHLAFRPTINSYRRLDRGAWSPEDVSWGFESRTAAIRAVTTPHAAAARLEHRVPGADVNPYLTIALMLAAGLDGIEAGVEPPAPTPGPLVPGERAALPRDLAASIAAFRASHFVAGALGHALRDHYVASREHEQRAFDAWLAAHVTDFEFRRYFTGT